MSFSDWLFLTTSSGPSDIVVETDNLNPLSGNASLLIHDTAVPTGATVALMPKPTLFDTRVESGKIYATFRRRSGSGFLDHGLFFLSQGTDPTRHDVVVYAVYYTTGGTNIRVMKYTNGLHNTNGTQLVNYNLPSAPTTGPAVMSVSWRAGLLTFSDRTHDYLDHTFITVGYGENTTDFNNIVTLGTVNDYSGPLFTGIGPGVFLRSRHASEPLYAVIDLVEIYRTNLH